MAHTVHTRHVDGKSIRFGYDPVEKEIDIRGAVEAHDLVQAIAGEFADTIGEDYPLGACTNGESGRNLCMAPGWKIREASKSRVTNPGEGSDFA
jgi:hypothetical protein